MHYPEGPDRPDSLYLHPLNVPNGVIWFAKQPVGVNTLSKVVSGICNEAQFPGYFTNHSLRAIAAMHLYDANIDEQMICETTGHRSNSICCYKCTSESKKRAISTILQNHRKCAKDCKQVSYTFAKPHDDNDDHDFKSETGTLCQLSNVDGYITLNVNVNVKS